MTGAVWRRGVWAPWVLHLVPPPDDPSHPEYAFRIVYGMHVWLSVCRSLTTGVARNPVMWGRFSGTKICRACLLWDIQREESTWTPLQ
jgi:hypothetical protein